MCVNYFFYGETLADYFGALVQREEPLQFLARYHRFISFALYLAGEEASASVASTTAPGPRRRMLWKRLWIVKHRM